MGIYVQYHLGDNYTSQTIDAEWFERPGADDVFVTFRKKNSDGSWEEVAALNKNSIIAIYKDIPNCNLQKHTNATTISAIKPRESKK